MKHILAFLLLVIISFEVSAQIKGEIAGDTLETIIVTAQLREQQVLDIPVTLSTISAQMLENTHTTNLEQLSNFVPGLNIRIQTPHRPSFVIRGLTSDEVSPTAQPRVSVYYNQVPTSRASMAVSELYDMERIEVLKGPQGTLFGRGAQIGAINFITKKPDSGFGGYLSAGTGSFAMKEVEGAANIPVIGDKLFTRVAGIYSYQDGYITNLSGGKLNGKNTIGGRFSARYIPIQNLKIDWVVNYQKDDNPGTAFMSKRYPNTKGEYDIFNYEASLDDGKDFYNKRDVFGSSLDAKYYINEHNYITSITSYYKNSADSKWDGDGTIAPAIDMSELVKANQFMQEFRYNFAPSSRLNGLIGLSYWREDVKQKYWFGPNEQYMIYPLLEMMSQSFPVPMEVPPLVMGDGKSYPMPAIPGALLGSPYDIPLPTNHEEENNSGAINSAYDIFADATFLIFPKLSLTAGIRGTYETFKTTNESHMIGETPSTLGSLMGGTTRNFFFAEAPYSEVTKDFLSLTYRANLKYDISNHSNVYASYSKGRRPNVVQYNSAGESEVMSAETVHSFDAGYKWTAQQRYWFDAGVFYQLYKNFQTSKWDNANYLIDDAGKAIAYGIEATAKAVLLENLEVFGNYAYIHARFSDEDSEGSKQLYAGKTFRLTPENSFLIGFNAKANISRNIQVVFTPTYSWKSHVWFEDSNELQPENPTLARLEQDAYGLLNANLAFKLSNPNLTLSVFGANLLNEKFIISAGNTGMMFGLPTYIPGMPSTFGAKLRWNF
ncbi:TonB-dependent receptor [termite gut metagenome]|uniref:TonB-dependent receptor n=1 Tax=termite gut metagenome TaxID=433724 RepID=A0A5J4R6G6_9ZZZZ